MVSIAWMWSLNPSAVILSPDSWEQQIEKSLGADRYVVEEREYQERNQPLDSRSAIQIGSDSNLEKRRKISYETVKGKRNEKPHSINELGRFNEDQRNANKEGD